MKKWLVTLTIISCLALAISIFSVARLYIKVNGLIDLIEEEHKFFQEELKIAEIERNVLGDTTTANCEAINGLVNFSMAVEKWSEDVYIDMMRTRMLMMDLHPQIKDYPEIKKKYLEYKRAIEKAQKEKEKIRK